MELPVYIYLSEGSRRRKIDWMVQYSRLRHTNAKYFYGSVPAHLISFKDIAGRAVVTR